MHLLSLILLLSRILKIPSRHTLHDNIARNILDDLISPHYYIYTSVTFQITSPNHHLSLSLFLSLPPRHTPLHRLQKEKNLTTPIVQRTERERERERREREITLSGFTQKNL